MDSFYQLRVRALEITQHGHDPQVGELARIIERLCAACEDLEKQVKAAQSNAKQAKRATEAM